MKKLEPKKYDKNERSEPAKESDVPKGPIKTIIDDHEENKPKPVDKVKEKPDYTWVWILVGLLSAIAVVYFMNVNNTKENGNSEPQK